MSPRNEFEIIDEPFLEHFMHEVSLLWHQRGRRYSALFTQVKWLLVQIPITISEGRRKTVKFNRTSSLFFSAALIAMPMKCRIRINQEHSYS